MTIKNKQMEKKCGFAKCNPVWAGDGYFCSECMDKFYEEKALNVAKRNKILKRKSW